MLQRVVQEQCLNVLLPNGTDPDSFCFAKPDTLQVAFPASKDLLHDKLALLFVFAGLCLHLLLLEYILAHNNKGRKPCHGLNVCIRVNDDGVPLLEKVCGHLLKMLNECLN